jgi:DNA polymerase-1
MGRRMNAGEDLHYAFAAVVKGVSYADMVASRDKEARGGAKAYNFGLPGGLGVGTFCKLAYKNYGLKLTPEQAAPQIDLWFRTFPEVRAYLQWISRMSAQSATGVFALTHPITGFVRGGCTYTSAANFGFQHLTAWAMKVALVEVTRRAFDPTSPLYGFRMWNFVHDEILCEGPRDRAQVAALELARVTAECFNTFVPTFPTTCDPVVSDVWSKSAESPIGPDGLPTPWFPAKS